jgi:acyl-CoA thioesterase-1
MIATKEKNFMEKMTTDVFSGDFPPVSYGSTLKEVEATISQVVECVFRDDDGILRSCVNGYTMKPMRVEDVKDRPQGLGTFVENSSIPRSAKPIWTNYENAGQASGNYLEALCAKAQITGDAQARELARRTVDAIVMLWENAAAAKHPNGGSGRGWFPKPYAGIRDVGEMYECSADQYCDVTLGLHSYYITLASEQEKRKIEEIVISFADWWYDHDYCGVYLGQAIWWKRLEGHSLAAGFFLYLNALAYSWKPCRKFQHGFEIWLELKEMLYPPEPIWVCGNGIPIECLERLIVLRPELAGYWRTTAAHQAKQLVACVTEKTALNKKYEVNGFASHYLAVAHRLLPNEGYDSLSRRCLEDCTRREHFYHLRRGLRIADLDPREKGDDMLDVYLCEAHVHWLAGYWKSRLQENKNLKIKQVLLIGDSISMGYLPFVQNLLKGRANVQRPDVNCESTLHGLQDIEKWLGENKWDVIHFNWGLHDMVRSRTENRDSAHIAGFPLQVPLPEYEKNLKKLVQRLKKTGAKLIWAATTPIPQGCMFRLSGEEVKYNEVALRVMKDENVPVDDLYAAAFPKLSELQDHEDVHFNSKGSELLAKAVAKSIIEQLNYE